MYFIRKKSRYILFLQLWIYPEHFWILFIHSSNAFKCNHVLIAWSFSAKQEDGLAGPIWKQRVRCECWKLINLGFLLKIKFGGWVPSVNHLQLDRGKREPEQGCWEEAGLGVGTSEGRTGLRNRPVQVTRLMTGLLPWVSLNTFGYSIAVNHFLPRLGVISHIGTFTRF